MLAHATHGIASFAGKLDQLTIRPARNTMPILVVAQFGCDTDLGRLD